MFQVKKYRLSTKAREDERHDDKITNEETEDDFLLKRITDDKDVDAFAAMCIIFARRFLFFFFFFFFCLVIKNASSFDDIRKDIGYKRRKDIKIHDKNHRPRDQSHLVFGRGKSHQDNRRREPRRGRRRVGFWAIEFQFQFI